MTSRTVTIGGYLLVLAGAAGLQLAARRSGSRVPPLGRLLAHVMGSRAGRIGVLTGWAWVGLHFFAR
ncbi:MAG: DUF6186 family protein [Actinomycetota bacterium]